ncbi:MAG: hypothetical protein HKP39_05575 [Eudoraea sp.]|nr:hypothetical protein [Eudoraea sp.]
MQPLKKEMIVKTLSLDAQIKIEALKDEILIKIMGSEYNRALNYIQGSFNFY